MHLISIRKLLFILLALLFTQACFDLPEELVLPVWDVNVNIPVLKKTYSLEELIKDDTSQVRFYKSGDKKDLLYFIDQQNLDARRVEDNLSIDPFSTQFSQKIDHIEIKNIDPVKASILVSDWTADVLPGQLRIFPESEGDLRLGFDRMDAFESVELDAGTMFINILNRLPIPLEIRGFRLVNGDDGTAFIEQPASQVITLDPFTSTDLEYDLAGKTIRDSIVFDGVIYTPGSGMNVVQIPEEAGTEVTARFKNLQISRVTARLPQQDPIEVDSTFTVDDSTQIVRAVMKRGSFELVLNNYMDLDMRINIKLPNFKKPDGTSYEIPINIKRYETNKIISEPSLKDWSIISLNGQPENQFRYMATVYTDSSEDSRTLSKNDSISVKFQSSELIFSDIEGRIKPSIFDLEPTSFNLDLGELKNKLSYDNIDFAEPNLYLNLSSSAQFDFLMSGKITATNGISQNTLSIADIRLTPNISQRINLLDYGLRDVLSSFSQSLPESFSFQGSALANPDYTLGSVRDDDSVSASIDVEFPLDIRVHNAILTDTTDVKSEDVSEEDVDPLQQAKLSVEIQNKIPADVIFSGTLIDSLGNKLLSIPPEYNAINEIHISAPPVDQNGNVSSAAITNLDLEIKGEDVLKFLHSPRLIAHLTLNTSNSESDTTVKFRTTDEISVKLTLTANYQIDEN